MNTKTRKSEIHEIKKLKDTDIENYIQTLIEKYNFHKQEILQLKSEKSLNKFINELAECTEYGTGEVRIGKDRYKYLIEGWESICIEEYVRKEKGDWEDDGYLYGLVQDKHEEVVKTDFLDKYKSVEILINDLRDGSQFGVSVIVARIIEE